MQQEQPSPGSDHLQRAAKELIGAARSFLDAAEEMIDEGDLVEEATGAIRTIAADLGAIARDPRAAGDSRPRETDTTDADDDRVPEGQTATGGAEKATRSGDRSTSTRVRRIDVE